jgi:hypothetical protein
MVFPSFRSALQVKVIRKGKTTHTPVWIYKPFIGEPLGCKWTIVICISSSIAVAILEVAGITDAITVTILLVWIIFIGTVITDIPYTILIKIGLVRIGYVYAVVSIVTYAIAVGVAAIASAGVDYFYTACVYRG